jgi:hypothetical protein
MKVLFWKLSIKSFSCGKDNIITETDDDTGENT